MIALALSSCAGRPTGVLQTVAAAQGVPGTSKVDMLVVTDRQASNDPGIRFTGERSTKTAYTAMRISIPPDDLRKPGTVQWPKQLPPDPRTDFTVERSDALDGPSGAAASQTRRKGRRILIFVHGFNNRYEDAVFRFAQIVHDSGAPVDPVLYTWPSRGNVLAYGYDRESTNYSRNSLERLLHDLARDPSVAEITVLAHSMGNWLTLEALRQMAIRDRRVDPKIHDVILAAPDVDLDLAREAFRDLGERRPRLTLMVSDDDQALAVSRLVWGNSIRLGAIDPNVEPYRTELAEAKINVVDLTKVKGDDPLNHAKFASGDVVALLGRRLSDGQPLSDGRVGLGDRLVTTATSAAGTVATGAALAVATPFAVVDPDTRDTYSQHLESLGTGFKNTIGSGADLAASPIRSLAPP